MSDIVSNQETGLGCLIILIVIIIPLFVSYKCTFDSSLSLDAEVFIFEISNICKNCSNLSFIWLYLFYSVIYIFFY